MAKILLKPNQYALIKSKRDTGQVLTENGDFSYATAGELPYIIFENEKDAFEYAENSLKGNSNLELILFNAKLSPTHKIDMDGIHRLSY